MKVLVRREYSPCVKAPKATEKLETEPGDIGIAYSTGGLERGSAIWVKMHQTGGIVYDDFGLRLKEPMADSRVEELLKGALADLEVDNLSIEQICRVIRSVLEGPSSI